MDYVKLRNLLLSRGQAHQSDCVKLSATKYIRASDWEQLKRYEQNYLKCYASGTAAHTGLLVGRSAGQFLGLWILPLKEEFVELAHTSGKPPSSTQWPPGVIYRHIPIASMDYQEFEAVDGTGSSFLRATTVERTIVDIARLHGLRHGVAALDSWLEGEAPMNVQVKQNQIAATIARLTGKKGIAVAREALAKSISLSESPYESLFRIILTEHGISRAGFLQAAAQGSLHSEVRIRHRSHIRFGINGQVRGFKAVKGNAVGEVRQFKGQCQIVGVVRHGSQA